MKIFSPLYERLISYTGVAAAMLAANNKVAEAQIIYTDVNPDHSFSDWDTSPYQLDVNNDGVVDFEFYNTGWEAPGPWCGSSSAYVNALGSNEIMMDGKPVDHVFLIGSQQNWDVDGHIREVDCFWTSGGPGYCSCFDGGNWEDEEEAFMGLKFVINNESYYGWLRLRTWGLTIKDYAFQSISGEPIAAGAVENCDTLQVTVSPAGSVHVCALLGETTLEANYSSITYSVNCRWQKDNNDIPNAVSQTLVVSQPGIYRAIIDGYGCADTSTAVTVTYSTSISPPPTISQHLDTLFSSPQSNYMWYKYNMLIPYATGQFYVISEDGLYHCGYKDSLNCLSYLANFDATTCSSTQVTIDQGSSGVICANATHTLCSVAIPSNSTYQWLANEESIPGATNFCHTASFPGNITVAIESYAGCRDTSAVYSLIGDTVPTPMITIINDTTLQSSSATGNQWYLNGVLINGANDQTYVASEPAFYYVKVSSSNNCSASSATIYLSLTGTLDPSIQDDFVLFADNHKLYIQFSQLPFHSKLTIVDLAGNQVFESVIQHSSLVLDVHALAAGIYFLIVDDGKTQQVKKVFIGE